MNTASTWPGKQPILAAVQGALALCTARASPTLLAASIDKDGGGRDEADRGAHTSAGTHHQLTVLIVVGRCQDLVASSTP